MAQTSVCGFCNRKDQPQQTEVCATLDAVGNFCRVLRRRDEFLPSDHARTQARKILPTANLYKTID